MARRRLPIGQGGSFAVGPVPNRDVYRSLRGQIADTPDMIGPLRLVVVLSVATTLLAQTPPTEPGQKRDRIGERSQEMRDQIDSGRQVKSHVRVSVRLKNGNKLGGVVKDGRLVERVDGLRFVDAQAQEAGAGIRLWYSTGGRNYVFVPFADLSEYQVLERMSQKQLEDIEHEMQKTEERRAAQLRDDAARVLDANRQPPVVPVEGEVPSGEAAVDVPPAPGQEPAPAVPAVPKKAGRKTAAQVTAEAAAKEKAAAEVAAKDQQKEYFALLQEFPPAAGWNQAKRDEIARRKVVIGAVPSAQELRFVEKFAVWQKACEFFQVKAEAKADAEGTPGTTTTGQAGSAPTESPDTGKKSRRKKS